MERQVINVNLSDRRRNEWVRNITEAKDTLSRIPKLKDIVGMQTCKDMPDQDTHIARRKETHVQYWQMIGFPADEFLNFFLYFFVSPIIKCTS